MAAEELTSEDIQFIKELREARNNQSITRRQALGLLAGAGIGAGAGAVGTQQVTAAADTTDSDGNVGLPNDRVDVFADGVDAAAEVSATSVNADEGTITNETFVVADRQSDTASTSADTLISIVDTEVKDNRGEFDSSQHLTPDKSGEYRFSFVARIGGSTSTGDILKFQVKNLTDATPIAGAEESATAPVTRCQITLTAELSAGKEYQVVGANSDSSFKITQSFTRLAITREVIQ